VQRLMKKSSLPKILEQWIATQERWADPCFILDAGQGAFPNRKARILFKLTNKTLSLELFLQGVLGSHKKKSKLFPKAIETLKYAELKNVFGNTRKTFDAQARHISKQTSLWILQDQTEHLSLRSDLVAATLKIQRTQEQLLREKKLSSLSRLSSGLAHEISQPLTILLGYLHELKRNPSNTKALTEVEQSALRIRDLIQLLKRDVEHTKDHLDSMDIEELLNKQIEDFVKNLNIPTETFHIVKAKDLGIQHVLIDRIAMEQVIKNVFKNAFDAILTANGKLTERDITIELRNENDAYISVVISDRGPGMDPTQLERVMEPFFTTKGPDKGTGLGLFLVRHYLDLMGAKCQISSQKGQGTRVKLLLPKA